MEQGTEPVEITVEEMGRSVVYVSVVCVCLRMCACCMLHDNLRGGARGGGLHGGPNQLYCQLGVRGGSLGQVVGQPGVRCDNGLPLGNNDLPGRLAVGSG